MKTFTQCKLWTITGSALLGGTYVFFATLRIHGDSLSVWGLSLAVACGAALCACASSAVCRFYETWRHLRESQHRPIVQTLYFSGVGTHSLSEDLDVVQRTPEAKPGKTISPQARMSS